MIPFKNTLCVSFHSIPHDSLSMSALTQETIKPEHNSPFEPKLTSHDFPSNSTVWLSRSDPLHSQQLAYKLHLPSSTSSSLEGHLAHQWPRPRMVLVLAHVLYSWPSWLPTWVACLWGYMEMWMVWMWLKGLQSYMGTHLSMRGTTTICPLRLGLT